MTLNVSTPALLFPAISLLMLAYTNRFLAIASLIRSLHDVWKSTQEDHLLLQIQNLRRRVRLIRDMQALGVTAISSCVGSMLMLFLELENWGAGLFFLSLCLMLASLVLSMLEIFLSVGALNVVLQDLQSNVRKGRSYPRSENP
jgi:hypothetical protein